MLLLAGPFKIEVADIGSRGRLVIADLDYVLAVGNFLPDGLFVVEELARLVHVGEFHRFAQTDRAGVRFFLADQHPEQGGLARAVWPDHADDAAGRQVEVQAVDQQLVAKGLAQIFDLDHQVAQPRSGRDIDLVGFVTLLGFLRR